MSILRRKFSLGVRLKPNTTAATLEGELYANSADLTFKVYIQGQERDLVTVDQAQDLTNKKLISADMDTGVSGSAISTDGTFVAVAASDTILPSQLAVKTYVDAQILTEDEAVEIVFDPASSTLTTANVQAAIDETVGRLDTAEGTLGTTVTGLSDHLADTVDSHDASAISVAGPTGNLAATDVQSAVDELQTDVDTRTVASGGSLTNGSLITPIRSDVKQGSDSALVTYAATFTPPLGNGQLCFATDTKKMYQVIDGLLKTVGGSGTSFEINQAHILVVGEGIYYNGSAFVSAQANAEGTLAMHVVVEVIDPNNFVAADFGRVEDVELLTNPDSLVAGSYYYQSEASAGLPISTEPSTGFSNPLFYVEALSGVSPNIIATLQIKCLRPSPVGDTIALDTLSDVSTPAPADGEILTWVDANSRWESVVAAAGGGASSSFTENQPGHPLIVGDGIYHDGSIFVKAQADDAATLAYYVVVAIDGADFTATDMARITVTGHGFIPIGGFFWASDSVAGTPTSTEPITGFSNPLFYVEDANTLQIKCYRPDAIQGINLDDLDDVSTPTPTDGQVLSYNNGTSLWEPATPVSAATDVTYSNATSGLAASNTQAAIDVVEGRLDTTETEVRELEKATRINYIPNPDLKVDLTGYNEYLDAAGLNPEDGTGGTALGTVASRNTISPMRGDADLKIAKDAVNRQGEGVSIDFTIDKADQAQKLTISIDYDASHPNYADGDIRFSVYDTSVNANLIRINGEDLKGGNGTHIAQFQSASDSTSYRLIMHVSSVSDLAYDVFMDNIKVGPTNIAKGSIVSDWIDYTSTLGGVSATQTFKYRRVGDSINIKGSIEMTGGVSGSIYFKLPSGMSLDADKLQKGLLNADGYQIVGSALARDISPATHYNAAIVRNAASLDEFYMTSAGDSGTNLTWATAVPFTWVNTDSLQVEITVPIQGWSSDTAMSSDLGGRDISTSILGVLPTQTTITSTFGGGTNLIFGSVSKDTAAIYNTSTGVTTIPETGDYSFDVQAFLGGTESANDYAGIYLGVNGTDVFTPFSRVNGTVSNTPMNCTGILEFTKGDLLTFRIVSNISSPAISANGDSSHFSLVKLASPQTVLETETVAARYGHSTGSSISNGANIFHDSKYNDTHNAYNTLSGIYTIPISGYYQVNATSRSTDTSSTSISITKNGSAQSYSQGPPSTNASNNYADLIYFEKGNTVAIANVSGSAITLTADARYNIFSIARIK